MAASAWNPCAQALSALAPAGRLRAAINWGNAVLAHRSASGEVEGVSVDLANELARRLGVPLELVVVDGAAKSVDAVAQGSADVGFFAIDPGRGESVAFTSPYLLIEGSYLVRDDSPLRDNMAVDRAGHRIVVKQGSAYDLYLSREIRQATLVRVSGPDAVLGAFDASGAEVAAGIRPVLARQVAEREDLRLLPGHFMVIRQAMGCARRAGPEAVQALSAFLEGMKREGFITQALERHRIDSATVAPPA